MPNYLVQWRIDAEADTFESAAREAWAAMRAPGSIASHFEVIDRETGEVVDVDLWKLDGAGDPCLCGGSPADCAAAAPNLLAALERLLAAPDLKLDSLEDETLAAIEQASATIARAKGETN